MNPIISFLIGTTFIATATFVLTLMVLVHFSRIKTFIEDVWVTIVGVASSLLVALMLASQPVPQFVPSVDIHDGNVTAYAHVAYQTPYAPPSFEP